MKSKFLWYIQIFISNSILMFMDAPHNNFIDIYIMINISEMKIISLKIKSFASSLDSHYYVRRRLRCTRRRGAAASTYTYTQSREQDVEGGSREGGQEGQQPGGRQGFVSLSMGNQVSRLVGRPLSISVLLTVCNSLCRVRRILSRAFALHLFFSPRPR